MIFYQHQYEIKQKLEPAFNYFLKKEYLLKFFKKAKSNKLFLKSKDEDTLIKPNEIILLYSKFGDYFTEIEVHVLAITKYSKITTKIIPGNVYYDNWSIDHFQSEDFKENTPITIDTILFKQKQDYIEIVESVGLEHATWFQGLYWKTIGYGMKLINKKKHRQIKEEIENVSSLES
jgi:hypothetical protein